MKVRLTVTLDDDAFERIRRESRSRGTPFRDTLNDLLRTVLTDGDRRRRRTLKIQPVHMGYKAGLNYGSIGSLLEYGEGEDMI